MKKNIKVLSILFCLLLFSEISAQTSKSYIEDKIKVDLASKYGSVYSIGVIENVNEDISKYRDFKFPITDPYNTLKDCYIFPAYVPAGGLIGVYKDDKILWDSGPIIEPGVNQDILGTQDLNNDGNVDIMASFYYGLRNSSQSIWIFSWNGQTGSLLNDTKQYGDLEKSVIFSFSWFTDILDINGDGILEIKGQDEDTRLTKIYSWNGSKYGDYSVQMPKYVPMNILKAKVTCKVKRTQDGFLFQYSIKNYSTSKQSIWRFAVEKMFHWVFDFGAPQKWQGYYSDEGDILEWGIMTNQIYYPYNFLKPGDAIDDIAFTNDSIVPYIANFYIQGQNGKVSLDNKTLFENSFNGKTLCGKYPDSPFVPIKFLDTLLNYNSRSYSLGWVKDSLTANKYNSFFTSAKTQLQQNNIAGVKSTLNQVLQDVDIDSTSNLTSEAYALIKYNTEYLLEYLPTANPVSLAVNLKNSSNSLIAGGSLQYYDGGWKDAVNNGNGTFGINTDKTTLSLRMNYAFGSQTVSNIPAQNNTYTFHTTNVSVQLKDSQGNLIDEGTVKYYAGGWRDFGTTINGVVSKELLPNNYSFRMSYAYGSNDKQQNIGDNPTVVFETVIANVQLKNSLGNLIDQGTVKYYAGGWRDFGTTTNGVAAKELLPNNYSFRMSYAHGSNDKHQNIGDNPTIVFQTVSANVQLKNSLGNLIDEGTVKYYAGGWRDFGSTTNGAATKELLPNNYSFRMSYAYGSNDKQQNIGVNPTVIFQTVNANVQLMNSQGTLIDQGTVQYYAGGWRDFGSTTNGAATKELLPNNYSFRITYEFVSNDKQQNIGTNGTITFSTVLCIIDVKNSQNQPVDGADIKYYSGGWREIGQTVNGQITKELLPKTLTFRMSHNSVRQDKSQDISANDTVEFNTGE